MQMFEFFVLRGHSLSELAGLSTAEKILMHHAMERYYKVWEAAADG